MQTTEYGDVILSTDDVISGLYSGKITNLDNIFLENQQEINKFTHACKENFEKLGNIKSFIDYDITKDEFDKINQNDWFMGEYYKELDIAKWLLERCTRQEELDRVQKELILFVQHNMMDVLKYLKYLVDTMRYYNILWGVGRGSSVASYCLFLIGVHKIDSIKYKLDINEFLK